MRLVLVTGKGGVGKTTAAAAVASLAAAGGAKTLLLSTDPGPALAGVLGVPAGPVGVRPAVGGGDPLVDAVTEVTPGLYAGQVDPQARLSLAWRTVSAYLGGLLEASGMEPVAAEELGLLPGVADVLTLLAVRDQAAAGRFDVLVVDAPATGPALRLLALPETVRWSVERAYPAERRLARSLRPLLARVSGGPAPPDRAVEAADRLSRELAEVRDLLTGPGASVRLVLTPERTVLAESRRALAALALHGYRVDAVVANRVMADRPDGAWPAAWAGAHAAALAGLRAEVAPLPVHSCPYLAAEPLGPAALLAAGRATYGDTDPLAPPPSGPLLEVARDGEEFVLRLALPLAERAGLGLCRVGDDLVVTAAGERRVLSLPSALRRCTVAGARLTDEGLRVVFRPDPAVWMR